MKLMDKAKQAALAAAVKTGLGYLEKDPEVNIAKLMELVDKFVPDGWYESQRNAIRNAFLCDSYQPSGMSHREMQSVMQSRIRTATGIN